LGSVASGKWVLHPSYMRDCKKAGRLLDESSYEWSEHLEQCSTDLEKGLGAAAKRWRLVVSSGKATGALAGFRVLIHTSASRAEAFGRLIKLGGGTVLTSSKPPYSGYVEDATHCLSEPQKVSKGEQKLDYRALAANGVAVVSPLYVNEFLTQDPPPKPEGFMLEDYRKVWLSLHK